MNRHIIVYIQDSDHWYTNKFGPELVLGFNIDDPFRLSVNPTVPPYFKGK